MKEIKLALQNYSKEHAWVTDGVSIGWLDGSPLQGTYRTVAVTNAKQAIGFENPNYVNDAYLIANAPEWLASLVSKVEEMQKALEWYANGWNYVIGSSPQMSVIAVIADDGERARIALKGAN